MADGGPHANGEEQEILAQYSGWGGLSDAFEPNKDSWHSEYTELKSLLTEEEYAAARSSTLTAFYTPPEVIDAMYTTLRKMGVGAGTILEPSMGAGAFFGQSHSYLYEPTTRLFGVELDSLTGRIARQLYQKANIQITGFEKADLPDSFFDVVIGNVPFGDYSVVDPQYNRLHFKIHDYFFAKSIDKLRTGGIIAFITTSGTLDKKSEEVRRYINARCDFIGAVRLPDSTFKSAGTKAMADIIFLQKRDRILEQDASWLHTTQTEDGLSLNSYFAEHPEMVCGTLKTVSGPYGPTLTCEAFADKPLPDVLQEAMSHLHAEFHFQDIELQESGAVDASIPAEPDVRNFSFCIRNGKFYYRENAIMREVSLGATSAARMRQLIELRDTTRDLIQAQLEDMPDEVITELQAKLNRQYDHYHSKFGLINSRGASLDMRDDSGYFLLCSLENLDSEGNFIGKSDMFSKRTIRAARPAERVETASEALALSVGERAGIDFGYMQQLTGKDKDTLVNDLQGVIFADPLEKNSDGEPRYYTADEYLSGDVRHKLQVAKLAAQNNPAFAVNVQALETVQPKDLEASEIAVRLGATWLAPELIKQFADELVDAPYYVRDRVKVLYIPLTGVWNVTNKSFTGGNIKATVTYGTQRANFYHILEESLNLRDVRVFDTKEDMQGNKIRVLNAAATQEAQMKQQQIEDAFKDWIWKDPTRRQMLVKEYNERFNSLRPREYDGSHILFHGMSPEITLRPHQKNAIAHILYGGNTLLAHVVGAGKTYEMVAAAMEKKRLGLCSKTLICVPNHLTEQLAGEALQLYPNANILVARRTDFEKANRKRFCAKIATGNYDIIVIGHSQFERIPLSQERQVEYLQSQIHDVISQVAQLKEERAENFTVKQMERMRKQLEKKPDKLNDQSRNGRMIRQGNTNAEVYEYRYVTEASFDSYMWQLLETKQKFIGQIMTSKSPARSADDLDDAALSYAEVKALAAGNPMIKEKMDLDIQVSRLKTLKTAYNNEHYRLEDAITQGFPAEMRKTAQQLENAKADTALLQQNTKRDADDKDVFAISLMDTVYTKREDAGKALLGLLGMAMNRTEPVSIGRYKGFDLQIAYFAMDKMYLAYLVGSGINPVQLGADAVGNTVRLDNCLHNLPQSVTDLESKLVQLQKQLENAKEQLAQPFVQADELAEKSKRLAELEALLNLNEKDIVLDTVPDEEQQCRSDNRQRGQER